MRGPAAFSLLFLPLFSHVRGTQEISNQSKAWRQNLREATLQRTHGSTPFRKLQGIFGPSNPVQKKLRTSGWSEARVLTNTTAARYLEPGS